MISHPILMLIPSPPGDSDPGGNSASAGFAHCRRSQRVPHLDGAWTHCIKLAFLTAPWYLSPTTELHISLVCWASITLLVFSSQPMASPTKEA
jgi:hypothetical protein